LRSGGNIPAVKAEHDLQLPASTITNSSSASRRDEPADFLDLVQELRETESSRYTACKVRRCSPCLNMRLVDALDALGGAAIAEPIEPKERQGSVGRKSARLKHSHRASESWCIWMASSGAFNVEASCSQSATVAHTHAAR